MILQTWRREMPKDISDEELSRKDISCRERPLSAVHVNNLAVYRETVSNVSENFNALEKLLSNSFRSAAVTYSQPSHISKSTAHFKGCSV